MPLTTVWSLLVPNPYASVEELFSTRLPLTVSVPVPSETPGDKVAPLAIVTPPPPPQMTVPLPARVWPATNVIPPPARPVRSRNAPPPTVIVGLLVMPPPVIAKVPLFTVVAPVYELVGPDRV